MSMTITIGNDRLLSIAGRGFAGEAVPLTIGGLPEGVSAGAVQAALVDPTRKLLAACVEFSAGAGGVVSGVMDLATEELATYLSSIPTGSIRRVALIVHDADSDTVYGAGFAEIVAAPLPTQFSPIPPGVHYVTEAEMSRAIAAAVAGLATVARTGDYADLLNKPAIPAAQVNADWTAESGVAAILHKPATMTPTAHTHAATDLPSASTSAKGVVQLSTATNSTSQTTAATSSAVKSAYDRGTSAINSVNNLSSDVVRKSWASDAKNDIVRDTVGQRLEAVTVDAIGYSRNGEIPGGIYSSAVGLSLWGSYGKNYGDNPAAALSCFRLTFTSDDYGYKCLDPFGRDALAFWSAADSGQTWEDGRTWSLDTSSASTMFVLEQFGTTQLTVNGDFWKDVIMIGGPTPEYGSPPYGPSYACYPSFDYDSGGNPVGYLFYVNFYDASTYWEEQYPNTCGYAVMHVRFTVSDQGRLDLTAWCDSSDVYFNDENYNSVYPDNVSDLPLNLRASTAYNSEYSDQGYWHEPHYEWGSWIESGYPRYAFLSSTPLLGWTPSLDAALGVPSAKRPVAPSISLSTGEYADAKATADALAGKAASSALRYDLKSATASGTTSQTVTVSDRAITSVSLNSACTSLTINPPSAVSGKARDFLMRVTVQGSAGPSTVTFGSGQTIDIGATDLTEMETGVNVLAFTEISANHWMAARRGA